MKKSLLAAIIFILAITFASAQTKKDLSEKALSNMSLADVCKKLGIDPCYNSRYGIIILPLCNAGIELFKIESNPYARNTKHPEIYKCYCYIGTREQNETLKRNLIANRHLLENGEIPPTNLRLWKIIE